MASQAPEVVLSPESEYSEKSMIDKERDNKEIITTHEKEQTAHFVPDARNDIETQRNSKASRVWPWKWMIGILAVALCMMAVGIGIGYAIGENNNGNSDAVGSSAKAGFTNPPRSDGRCGPQFGDATCDPTGGFGGCCSDKGWCGHNEAHCLVCKGCQWGCTNNSTIC